MQVSDHFLALFKRLEDKIQLFHMFEVSVFQKQVVFLCEGHELKSLILIEKVKTVLVNVLF